MASLCSGSWLLLMCLSLFFSSALKTDFLESDSASARAHVEASTWHWSSSSPGLPAIESMAIQRNRQVRGLLHATKAEPMYIKFNLRGASYFSRITEALIILLVIVGLVIGVTSLAQSDSSDSSTSPAQPRPAGMAIQRIKASPPLSTQDLQLAMEGCDGSWARMYKRVPIDELEALELLFRCGLVPVQDFDISSVPTDHIHECVGIAKDMLKDKPLDDWVESWAEAIQVFEESKTARQSVQDVMLAVEPISDVASGIVPHPSSLRDSEAIRQTVPSFGRSSAMPSRSNIDQALFARCREIMSQNKPLQYQPRSRRDNESIPVSSTQNRSVPATVQETEEEHIVVGGQETGALPPSNIAQRPRSSPAIVKLNAYERFTDTQISSSSGQIYTGNLTYDVNQRLKSEDAINDNRSSARLPMSR